MLIKNSAQHIKISQLVVKKERKMKKKHFQFKILDQLKKSLSK